MTPVATVRVRKVDLELATIFFSNKFHIGQKLQENVLGFG